MNDENECSDCKHRYKNICVLFDDLIRYTDHCFMWEER